MLNWEKKPIEVFVIFALIIIAAFIALTKEKANTIGFIAILAALIIAAVALAYEDPGDDPPTNPPIESTISFSQPTIDIEVGEHQDLINYIEGDNLSLSSLVWSSSEPDIVSVDQSGYILGKNEGKAIIIVSADNNVDAKCYINVSKGKESVDLPYTSDALSYGGHHYYIYDEEGTNWNDACERCLARGGYLAVINDEDENNELFQYMKSQKYDTVYFGLIYDEYEEIWKYEYGDTSDYRDWGMNYKNKEQPNNYLKGDIHVALDVNMKNGTWNDVRYGRTDAYVANGHKYKNLHTYICEWPE